jgi:hypothetical protein
MWVVVALVVGLIMAPAAAVAATLVEVHVVGANGVAASLTRGGQLTTGQASPGTLRAFHYYDLEGSVCEAVYTPPIGYAFVLQSLAIDVFNAGAPGPGVNVRVATNAACDAQVADDNPSATGATSYVISPGIVIPSGHSLYAIGDNGIGGEVYGFGYLEPNRDAPTPTGATPGDAASRGHSQDGTS